MEEIIAGVRAFQRDVYPQHAELFELLANGQSPEALVITCSDSRIEPHLITQSRPGTLFVIRNAGNLVPKYGGPIDGAAATIEYAVVALEVRHIIICGHSGCGAMAGLLSPNELVGMPRVADWLQHAAVVREALATANELEAPGALQRAVEANVIVQLDHLRTHPSVVEKLQLGRLELHGWVYHIATGAVTRYDAERKEFAPL